MMFWGAIARQVFATLCVNLLSVGYGASIGWASPGMIVLQSNETTLTTGPLTKVDSSWIQSIFMIGGLFGSILYGWSTEAFGRKNSLISISIVQISSWIFIIIAKSSFLFFISRFLAGLAGGGLYIVVPLYVSEISEDSIRGRLGSTFIFSVGIGVLLSYTCGTFMALDIVPYIYIPISLLFLIGITFTPESPFYLIKKNKDNDAENSLKYYRSCETIELERRVNDEFASLKSLIVGQHAEGHKSVCLADFLTRPARRSLMFGVALQFLEQFCGCFVLLFYAATVFKQAGSNLSPNVSSIIIGIIQLCGAYVSTMLVDRAGRKFLICLSAFGISFGLLIFGLHSYLSTASSFDLTMFRWVPLVSFSFVLFIANFGVLTLPFLVMSEVTPPNIRSYVYTFCLMLSWIFAFIISKYLDATIELLGIAGVMFIFSINSFCGAVFVLLCVPETKGKSFADILQMLEK